MNIDGIIISKLKEELDSYLPIKINKISDLSKTEICFLVSTSKGKYNLIMSFHSDHGYILLTDKQYSTYNEPSNFTMVLRKYLINATINSITQNDYDRYLLFNITNKNEIYDLKNYILSIELMGKYANMVLVGENNKIIDSLKRISPFESEKRVIAQNIEFTLPDKQNKINPFNSDLIETDSLMKTYEGFSKLLENEVKFRLNKQSFKEIMNQIKDSHNLYITDNNDFHVIPLTHINNDYKEFSIFKGIEEIYEKMEEEERIKTISNDLLKFTRRSIKNLTNKLNKLNEALKDSNNYETYKNYGDLLYMSNELNKKGLKEIEITDYDGNPTLVKLDEKLSIKDNANKYYSLYQKRKKGISYLNEQITTAENELNYFKGISEQLDIANYLDALDIKEELTRLNYLKSNKRNRVNNKKQNFYQVKFREHTITYGKNNLQNAYVTFEYAKKNYTWFHAKDYHGAHVVVDSDNLDEDTIRYAANIAAYYSKARYSTSVPVDYTLVKNIKKVSGAKPGFVTLTNQKTIYIDPVKI